MENSSYTAGYNAEAELSGTEKSDPPNCDSFQMGYRWQPEMNTLTLIAIFTTKAQKTVALPIDTLSIEVAGMRTCSWNVWNSTATQLIVGWAHQISWKTHQNSQKDFKMAQRTRVHSFKGFSIKQLVQVVVPTILFLVFLHWFFRVKQKWKMKLWISAFSASLCKSRNRPLKPLNWIGPPPIGQVCHTPSTATCTLQCVPLMIWAAKICPSSTTFPLTNGKCAVHFEEH